MLPAQLHSMSEARMSPGPASSQGTYAYPNPGRVAIVHHPGAVLGFNNVDINAVQYMFDQGIMNLTGVFSSPAAALASLFPGLTTNSKIALKPNLINSSVPTRKEVVKVVINRLVEMLGGFPATNITLYERHNFAGCGYSTSYFGHNVKLVVDTSFPNLGYTIHCDGKDRPYSRTLHEADYLINMPVLKDHSCSTALNLTLAFKNHMGTVNPGGSNGIHCNKNAILDIMASNVMRNKQRLVILDALYAIYNGGPGGNPQATPMKMLLSQDPVAIDAQGRIMINNLRSTNGLGPKNATYIDQAAASPYSLGIADPALMTVVNLALPVNLAAFTASLDHGVIVLRWRTEGESNNSGFTVQRSMNGMLDWTDIGFVHGAGTTHEAREYSFVDDASAQLARGGSLYYRLRQLDSGGGIRYSPTVEVALQHRELEWNLEQNYPNPFAAGTDLPLHLPRAARLRLEVFDMSGARVVTLCDAEINAGMHYFHFDSGDLASGSYVARATAEGVVRDIHMLLLR